MPTATEPATCIPPVLPPLQLSVGAVADAISAATEIQATVGLFLPAEHVAFYGPHVRDVREGMIYVHQAWYALIMNVKNRATYLDVRTDLIRLAGVAIKIADDFALFPKYGNLGRVVTPSRPLALPGLSLDDDDDDDDNDDDD